MTEPVEQPKVKVRQKLEPEENSRLAFLFSQLPQLEAAKNEAEAGLKACKKAIMAEIAGAIDADKLPDQFDIPAEPNGAYPAYTLASRQGAWRVDADAMKNQDPEAYVRWAKRGDPYWELSRVRKNRVKR